MGAGGTTSDVSDEFLRKFYTDLKSATYHLPEEKISLRLALRQPKCDKLTTEDGKSLKHSHERA